MLRTYLNHLRCGVPWGKNNQFETSQNGCWVERKVKAEHLHFYSMMFYAQGGATITIPPCVVGTLTVTILLLAGSGSLAVRTLPPTVVPVIWKVCPPAVDTVVTVPDGPGRGEPVI